MLNVIVLSVAFILELVAFASFAALGYVLPIARFAQHLVFGVLLVFVIAFWSIYMAPKAPKKLTKPGYYIAKACIYSVSSFVLFTKIGNTMGIAFLVAAILDEIFLFRHNTA